MKHVFVTEQIVIIKGDEEFRTTKLVSTTCPCGAELCGKEVTHRLRVAKVMCNLEKNHEGLCFNTWLGG